MTEHTLWYTKRGDDILGPFPAKAISQALLIGRLKPTALVSLDKVEWLALGDVEALVPEVMKADMTDPEAQARLEAARRAADERLARDRRSREKTTAAEQREGDRRQEESVEDIEERVARTERLQKLMKTERQSKWPLVVMMVLLTGMVAAAIWLTPSDNGAGDSDCEAPPTAGVNWDNCQMPGLSVGRASLSAASVRNANLTAANLAGGDLRDINLAYSNLSLADLSGSDLSNASLVGVDFRQASLAHADLRNADLSHADLRGANLLKARLDGAKLSKTIWWDGSVCGPASVGECIPVAGTARSLIAPGVR